MKIFDNKYEIGFLFRKDESEKISKGSLGMEKLIDTAINDLEKAVAELKEENKKKFRILIRE